MSTGDQSIKEDWEDRGTAEKLKELSASVFAETETIKLSTWNSLLSLAQS